MQIPALHRRLRLLALLLAFHAAGSVAEPVSLHFAWPESLTLLIEQQTEDSTPRGGRTISFSLASKTTLIAKLAPDGHEVGVETQSTSLKTNDPLMRRHTQRLIEIAESLPSRFHVGPDGRFVRSISTEESVQEIRTEMALVLNEMLPLAPKSTIDELIQSMVTEELLDQGIARLWNLMVGHWLPLADGQSTSDPNRAGEAVSRDTLKVGDTLNTGHGELTLLSQNDCERITTECVTLKYQTTMPPTMSPSGISVVRTDTFEVQTNPKTLVPYAATHRRELRALDSPGAPPSIRTTTYTFTSVGVDA